MKSSTVAGRKTEHGKEFVANVLVDTGGVNPQLEAELFRYQGKNDQTIVLVRHHKNGYVTDYVVEDYGDLTKKEYEPISNLAPTIWRCLHGAYQTCDNKGVEITLHGYGSHLGCVGGGQSSGAFGSSRRYAPFSVILE